MRTRVFKAVRLLFCLLQVPALLACATQVRLGNIDLETIIEDAEKRASVVERFRVDFVRTRRSHLFNRDITVEGRLVFQKPNTFSLTTEGDITVQILSDGEVISLVHDLTDREIYHVPGQVVFSRLSDPLLVVIHGIGNGALRNVSIENRTVDGEAIMVEVEPGVSSFFARAAKVFIWFSKGGELKKVRLAFKNGDIDETVFRSWVLLAANDPEIVELQRQLKEMSGVAESSPSQAASVSPKGSAMQIE